MQQQHDFFGQQEPAFENAYAFPEAPLSIEAQAASRLQRQTMLRRQEQSWKFAFLTATLLTWLGLVGYAYLLYAGPLFG